MYNILELTAELNKLKVLHAKLSGQRELLLKEMEDKTLELQKVKSSMELFDKSRLFLQHVSEAARHVAKVQIEEIVTKALQYVFGPNYSFKIDIRSTTTRPEADFLVVTKYGSRTVESLPTAGKGGGIVDILAIALKFSLLELVGFDGPIWMDEPFKHVSEDYIPAAGKLLTFMGETSGRQIIIITHNPRLAEMCNRTITVVQKNGHSKVT